MDFYKWVLDPNILISYCISKRLFELPIIVGKYNLVFCASEDLKNEFASVLARERIKKFLDKPLNFYTTNIDEFLTLYNIKKIFSGSPDVKDDYLIDIVEQTDAIGLVTGDKALLGWKNSPIQIVSWNDFQLTYPL